MIRIRNRRKSSSVGFTLIELLVVIAIIGILAAIILPALNRAREMASKAACVGNLKDMGLAMHMYAGDNNGYFPYDSTWPQPASNLVYLYPDYEPDWNIFICPSSDLAPATDEDSFIATSDTNEECRLSYGQQCVYGGLTQKHINLVGGRSIALLMDATRTDNKVELINAIVDIGGNRWYLNLSNPTHCPEPNHGTEGTNVLFMDGSARWFTTKPMDGIDLDGNGEDDWGIAVEEIPTLGQYKTEPNIPAQAFLNFGGPRGFWTR